eukprot:c21578_g2_i1 orf=1-225(-)
MNVSKRSPVLNIKLYPPQYTRCCAVVGRNESGSGGQVRGWVSLAGAPLQRQQQQQESKRVISFSFLNFFFFFSSS